MQASDILLRDLDDGGILRLTLNDPARRNALAEAMLAELSAAFEDAGPTLSSASSFWPRTGRLSARVTI